MVNGLTGFVFYRGPSMLDGQPIVAILTGLGKRSRNSKTGVLWQTWILREDISPIEAIHSGDDVSICGDCKHRGLIENGRNRKRKCYVKVHQAPLSVWRTYHRGKYPFLPMSVMRDLVADGKLRGGSYGDPAAVPIGIWEQFLDVVECNTAYTHQWRTFPELATFCMASVDSEDERMQAKLLGFRTFRMRGYADPVLAGEGPCPASKEAGQLKTCSTCMACDGNMRSARKADITIIDHGPGMASRHRAFERIAA